MRPTGIGFRSPKEKTPDFYSSFVRLPFFYFFWKTDHRGHQFFDQDPHTKSRIHYFAETKAGFGREDRFLYKKLERDM